MNPPFSFDFEQHMGLPIRWYIYILVKMFLVAYPRNYNFLLLCEITIEWNINILEE